MHIRAAVLTWYGHRVQATEVVKFVDKFAHALNAHGVQVSYCIGGINGDLK